MFKERKIERIKRKFVRDDEMAKLFVELVERGGYEFLKALSDSSDEGLREIDMIVNNHREVAALNLRRYAEQVEGDNQVHAFIVVDGEVQAYKTDSMEELGVAIIKNVARMESE